MKRGRKGGRKRTLNNGKEVEEDDSKVTRT